MLDKHYTAADVERAIYERWEQTNAFAATSGEGEPFCVMMPPPNVTGSLHMGHALDQTIQDVLTRFHRMQGVPCLWQPGTDHAGIATQMMVERKLAGEGKSRTGIGREAFLAECWSWKEASQGNILGQLRRLGTSPDWQRERFTMDEGLSKAVLKAFVKLHKQGLIYKDKRLVNWDCQLKTAVSDLESVPTEINGHLWYFSYPIEGQPDRFITVATTRPETMLGDTGIAVHPEDERYLDLHGHYALLPLVGRRIKIVADSYSDPEKGTGAVKITPAHDFNDFEVGRRHDLGLINILTDDGKLNDEVPQAYRGLDRFEVRKRVVADMDELELLAKIDKHPHTVPYGDRSGTPLEPYLTDQWYCDALTLAKPAIEAVETGKTVFVPKMWENTYFEWMRNIQPWCISRQLWWGHQIPAWYGPDGQVFVEETEAEALASAERHYGKSVDLERDPDVLDTWFSSGLWPFSTLGWPDETPELKQFYPTTVLVTGFDIIFFWVARMMMQGIHFTGEVPFKEIFIHGLVRDNKGQKMSKTKGNVIDPLEMIDEFGADALRYTLMASCAQGRDVRFDRARVEGYRNFVTKLWNASRFVAMNEGRLDPEFDPSSVQSTLNQWIIGETAKASQEITASLRAYRLNDAALSLYHFTWNTFCDWYVELAKSALQGEDKALKSETQSVAGWVLAQILHLMHPIAPFVSEHLWSEMFDAPGGMLATAPWPEYSDTLMVPEASEELDWLLRMIAGIRAARSELNVPAGAKLALEIHDANSVTLSRVARYEDALLRMARLENIQPGTGSIGQGTLQVVVDEATMVMAIGAVVDLGAEQQRLTKELGKLESEIKKLDSKLANENFVARAPDDVVAEQRERLTNNRAARDRMQAALQRIA